jgi:hypothetical protein
MIKKLTYLLAIPSILLLGSCATTQTAQQIDQNDDVYYSVAKAKEEVAVVAQVRPEETASKKDYVTDEQLYGDSYGNSYDGSYAERIYRFRDNAPWRNYYSNIYSFYDPFYSNSYGFNPYGYGNGLNISIGIGSGYYNPWRSYGYNYGSNFMGPYSYYNPWSPYNVGYLGGGYGGNYYGGYYGGGYGGGYIGNTIYNSPNYRPRPVRGSSDVNIDRGAVNGGSAGGVIRNGNGGTISRGRAERYGDGSTVTPRPQATTPRPARVSQQPQPQRNVQPERVSSSPRQESSGGSQNSGGGSRSNDSGGGGGRPSRN